MALSNLFIPHTCPIQFVPLEVTPNALYHYIQMDTDWYVNQTTYYVSNTNYYAPWQSNDVINLQVFTDGATNVQATLIDCHQKTISTTLLSEVVPPGWLYSNLVFEGSISLTGLTGIYYILLTAGSGPDVQSISEPLSIQPDQPQTLLFQYTHRQNTQSEVFSTGYSPTIRVEGYIGDFMPKANFVTYEDQPADLTMLNGIPYRSYLMYIGLRDGVPDWMTEKISKIMLLSNVTIDGFQYSREKDAQFESTVVPGTLKKYWKIAIREAKNRFGTTISGTTGVQTQPIVIYNIDGAAFGNNSSTGPEIIQVSETD